MKKLVVLLGILLLACGIYFGYALLNKNGDYSFHFDKTNKEDEEVKEVWPKVYNASLVATGDAVLHNAVYKDGYNSETDTFDYSNQLEYVRDIINKYDIAYYNQETIFGGKQLSVFPGNNGNIPGYNSYPTFNSPSGFGDAMVDAGFNVVSLASNHTADCKSKTYDCVNNAYNYWASKNVVFDGLNITEEKENKYNISEVNGITYGFLNYTYTLNGLDGYISNQKYLIDTYNSETAKKEIEELRSQVDVLIVSMHWHTGAEYSLTPTQSNKEIALYLSSLGVDIVLGTYSHCLQPFDIVGENNTVVFYSLGNFISNQGDLVPSIGYKGIVGVLASMDITKTVNEDGTKEIKIDNIGADLTYTYNLNHKNYRVIPFSKMNSSFLANYENVYDTYSKVLTEYNSNITIAPLASN